MEEHFVKNHYSKEELLSLPYYPSAKVQENLAKRKEKTN